MSGGVKSNVLNSNGANDIVFKRNDVDMFKFTATDLITESNTYLVSQGQVKCDIYIYIIVMVMIMLVLEDMALNILY